MISKSVYFITGGSRGIGLEIAKKLAKDGAKIAIAAKTDKPHPKLPGTIYTACQEIEAAGGQALPIKLDIRDDQGISDAIEQTVSHFGQLDGLINNASAIDNRGGIDLPSKYFDLMHSINSRGTYMVTKTALPHLLKSDNPRCLTLSPPLDLNPKWFKYGGTAYTMAKYNMSMMSLGFSQEFNNKIAFNCLWPKTAVATEAIRKVLGDKAMENCRSPEIMADAAIKILEKPTSYNGNFIIDEEILLEAGMDLDKYGRGFALPDLYVGDPEVFAKIAKLG